MGAYTLCLSAFMLSAGPLADRYGRKRTWLICGWVCRNFRAGGGRSGCALITRQ
ncbi:hypothetical protein [Imhoffiella purpurea]|uniref:hypothetical protein n=1 Tax=Imhoffiella purpurea TaxID=1249627 RepID=UPI0038B7F308